MRTDVLPRKKGRMLPDPERTYEQVIPEALLRYIPDKDQTLELFVCKLLAQGIKTGAIRDAILYFYGLDQVNDFRAFEFIYRVQKSPKLRKAIDKYRKKFNKALDEIPIANKAWRLQVAQDAVEKEMEKSKPNIVGLATMLSHVAKEKGELMPENSANIQINNNNTYANIAAEYEGDIIDVQSEVPSNEQRTIDSE